jgi:hypothetical protein
VTGEDTEDCGSLTDSSVSSHWSSSSVSVVESIQSRLSSISRPRLSGLNDDKLIASLEQSSELHIADSFSIGTINMETNHTNSFHSEKPSRLLAFGSSHENEMQMRQQSPSFMQRMQYSVGIRVHDREEVCNNAGKQRKQESLRPMNSEEGVQSVHFIGERDGLQNATPVAINIQRPSVLRTLASSTLFSRSPSLVKQSKPQNVADGELLDRARPIAMATKECLQRNCDHQLRPGMCNKESVSGSVGSCHFTAPKTASPKQSKVEVTDNWSEITENTSTFCAINQAKPSKPPLLPVSSSVIDIMTALIRLARFTETMNHVMKPVQGRQSIYTGQNSAEAFRWNPAESVSPVEDFDCGLKDKLTEAILCTVIVYAYNMLCMDLCGVSEEVAYSLIGNELFSQVQDFQQKQLIWGCRHMAPHGLPDSYYVVPDCLLYREKGIQRQDFERISFDMCVRINNVAALHCILPALYGHLMQVAENDLSANASKELISSYDSGSQYGSPTHSAGTLSYGPVNYDHSKSNASGNSPAISSLVSDNAVLETIIGRIADVQKCQIRLLCYRMNCFIKPSLKVLLSLVLPEKQYPLYRRLDPVLHYLAHHLSALADGLFPQSFLAFLQCLWDCLISDFKEMIDELPTEHGRSRDLAHLYLQSIALLVEFFHSGGAGADIDMLISTGGFVLEVLELHTLSTQKLIVVCNQLLKIVGQIYTRFKNILHKVDI